MLFHTEAGTLRKLGSESCSFVQERLRCSVGERLCWMSDCLVEVVFAWWLVEFLERWPALVFETPMVRMVADVFNC